MSEEVVFRDIMDPRRDMCGILAVMSRAWQPQKSFMLDKYYSPQDIKDLVAASVYIDSVIEAESARTGIQKEKLKKEVVGYLEEMGFDRKMHTIRWMGIFFLKVCNMMRIGVFVDEPAILKLKATMGKNPILFLPTHRSYADFCLMTYLCYHFNIDLPAVAAGMDFYSMVIVGRRMRETGAFYIRRTLVGAQLYAATLKQYVRTLVARNCGPIEFFLEGTRSRSNKSLAPKYGMLSMMLMPYFAREVDDITIVPVNISYERLMEQTLFAYEHLGVPKPKESTGGLLKALRTLNDHFGNIYISLGSPLSVKEYLQKDFSVSEETLKPLDLQQLTPEQFADVQDIANYTITLQQRNTVATTTSLLAVVLMQSIIKNELLHIEYVIKEVEWVLSVLKMLGALVLENDVRSSVERILVVHGKMWQIDKENRLRLLSGTLMNVSEEIKAKMKGHTLTAETMVNAVPLIQLQLYVNPLLHYLVPVAVIYLIVHKGPISREELIPQFNQVRTLLRYEFFHIERNEDATFSTALEYCLQNDVICRRGDSFVAGGNNKLQYLLQWSISPALTTALICMDIMTEVCSSEHKRASKLVQERVESRQCHPYCLSLESIGNCLQGLHLVGALAKGKNDSDVIYNVVPDKMEENRSVVSSILPPIQLSYGRENCVILDNRTVLAKL